MILDKTLKTLEFDKIMASVSAYAVLYCSKDYVLNEKPCENIQQANFSLDKTEEAHKLLFTHNCSGVYFFDDVSEFLTRADMGGTLINGELLKIAENLKGARILKTAILSVKDESLKIIPEIASRLYVNLDFEKEIASKIISEDEISDNASVNLARIRKDIRSINVAIREKLTSFMRGGNKYLQEGVITKRQDRYVVPVKSEYRSFVKGFIHDQSSSGATVFIEPEAVMELNNRLKGAMLDEYNEIRKILAELSNKVSTFSSAIRYNLENISEIDVAFAKAFYSFKNSCSKPILNSKGEMDIIGGRHPLIDPKKVKSINLNFGKNFNFLLISGPNTGGKTVTLKISGLFSLMAATGIFIPAFSGSKIAFFDGIFSDVGDEQSIEQSLSTFSSHMKNIIDILDNAGENSLVLIDEIGAGTDPEEGSALALSIIEKLSNKNCKGIITTHYSRLKEFAATSNKIENASMEFDSTTLKPKYKLNIGIPGSSNAIEISETLGLDSKVIDKAKSYLDGKQVSFEHVLKQAEESKIKADNLALELEKIKREKEFELEQIAVEKDKITAERKKISDNSKQEIKRIVADRLEEAEEILIELKKIIKTAELDASMVFKAGELKNRLKNSRYINFDKEEHFILKPVNLITLSVGDRVYVKSLSSEATILSINQKKKEAEVYVGSIKSIVKLSDLYNAEKPKQEKAKINVSKSTAFMPKLEINVVGKTSLEALTEVEYFIDQAVVNGAEEIKIIHGIGEGILLKEIRTYLKTDKRIAEFRRGKYGEGENGVTIVKLK